MVSLVVLQPDNHGAMDRLDGDLSLWQSVLEPVTVVMLQGRYNNLKKWNLIFEFFTRFFKISHFITNLFPLPSACLKLEQGRRYRVPPFWQEDNERERLAGVLKQPLKVTNHGVHQLFAEWGVRLKAAAVRFEVQQGTP